MAYELGTYTTEVPFTPYLFVPEPGDPITFDWMNVISQYSQRFNRIATVITSGTEIFTGAEYVFDYSSLQCDSHPPFLAAYFYDSVAFGRMTMAGTQQEGGTGGRGLATNALFYEIGLGTAKFKHWFEKGGGDSWWAVQLTAYL